MNLLFALSLLTCLSIASASEATNGGVDGTLNVKEIVRQDTSDLCVHQDDRAPEPVTALEMEKKFKSLSFGNMVKPFDVEDYYEDFNYIGEGNYGVVVSAKRIGSEPDA